MKFKKFASLALAAVLTTGLMTGCGNSKDASSEEIVTEIKEPVEITFWHAMNGDLEKTLQKLTDKFMEENKNITVTATPLGDFDPAYAPFIKRFEDNNIEFKLASCTGHAHPFDLIEIIDLIKPKLLVPIHSYHPERLYNKSGDVLLPEKKQTI